METFIYGTLNTATRDHDPNKINTLGPMAAALKWIVGGAEDKRPKDSESLTYASEIDLYRGLTLPQEKINEYKTMKGKEFCMGGFISTSQNKEKSLHFAFKNAGETKLPVLMHI